MRMEDQLRSREDAPTAVCDAAARTSPPRLFLPRGEHLFPPNRISPASSTGCANLRADFRPGERGSDAGSIADLEAYAERYGVPDASDFSTVHAPCRFTVRTAKSPSRD
jgi:hypothetical protein